MSDFAAAVAERQITQSCLFSVQDGVVRIDGAQAASYRAVRGNGRIAFTDDRLSAVFSGGAGSYDLRLLLPQPLEPANGLTVRYRISGWQTLRYLAIGHSSGTEFRHVKISNPADGEWVTFSIGYRDLAYGLANAWQQPADGPIGEVRLYISGTPAVQASIEIAWAAVWHEADAVLPAAAQQSDDRLRALLKRYFRGYNTAIDRHAEAFLQRGELPMMGHVTLPWALDEAVPAALSSSGTYRYLWHALQPAVALLVYGDDRGHMGAIAAAREQITAWLDRSYYRADEDVKYTWYDHGTAERLSALVLMYGIARQLGSDRRFLERLRGVMLRHGQLLESEAFYCRHQVTRYHNHGWFQDIALIAAAVALPELPCAARWIERAQQRLVDQFQHLIVQDGPFAISIENSIGYHQGVLRLADVAAQMIALAGVASPLAALVDQLRSWSKFLRYPDGRVPSQGDTVRRPNPLTPADRLARGRAYRTPSTTVLPQAGYAVVKGNHDGLPFMLCLFATSRSVTHKHEDDLALTLFYDGIEWLIDPSFFAHDYTQPIPAFLRSARAHTRLVVTDRPHRLTPGLTRVLPPTGDGTIRAESTAYEGLRLTRRLQCAPDALQIAVQDTVHGAVAAGSLALMLHCGEGVAVQVAGQRLRLRHPCSAAVLEIELPAESLVTTVSGPLDGAAEQGIAGADYGRVSATTLVKVPVATPDISWQLRAVATPERDDA